MITIDTSTWKEFCISDLFNISVSVDKNLLNSEMGNTPFVASSSANNGVTSYINEMPSQKANTLTIARNGSVGSVFYQCKNYCASPDDIRILTPKFKLNKQIGLFLKTIIEQEKFKYSYGRKLGTARIKNLIIKLPVDVNGNPNWQYMENYIDGLGIKLPETRNNGKNSPVLNMQEWKEFKLSDVFTNIENCKCSSAEELLEDGSDLFYIGAKKNDNGVIRQVKKRNELVSRGNGIIFICDGQGSIGYSLYADNDFIGSTTLSVGYNEELNKYNAMFIVTVSDLERFKYSFGRKRKSTLNDSIIKLPVTSEGCPDWQFMEEYIMTLPYSDII